MGSGLAILLGLLAWSDKIKSWHKETMEAEKEFCNKRKIDWNQIRELTRGESSEKKLLALSKLLNTKSIKDKKEVEIIDQFSSLSNKRDRLKKLYSVKYALVIILAFLFFISGTVNLFIESTNKLTILKFIFPAEYISICLCILYTLAVLFFIIYLNSKDSEYRNELINVAEKI